MSTTSGQYGRFSRRSRKLLRRTPTARKAPGRDPAGLADTVGVCSLDGKGGIIRPMKFGPFQFKKVDRQSVRCFEVPGLRERGNGDPELVVNMKVKIEEAGMTHLGVDQVEELWCIEDPSGIAQAVEFFDSYGFEANEVSPSGGKRFRRFVFDFPIISIQRKSVEDQGDEQDRPS